MSVGRWRRPRFWLGKRARVVSVADLGAYTPETDELDEDFEVAVDTQIETFDPAWEDSVAKSANADVDVIAATGRATFDAPTGTNHSIQLRWSGAPGDEIEVDIVRGDQAGDVNPGILIRDTGAAVGSQDTYRLNWDNGNTRFAVHRYVGGSFSQTLGIQVETWTAGSSLHLRVWARTMADRVRIYVEWAGTLYTFDDSSATRHAVAGLCGIYDAEDNDNATGIPTSWNNLVIRSTPIVYDDAFDYVAADSNLGLEDDWLDVSADANNFLQLNAANDRIAAILDGIGAIDFHYIAPSGLPSAGVLLDTHTYVDPSGGGFHEIGIRHDGASPATDNYYALSFNPFGGTPGRVYRANGGSQTNLLDLGAATPSFTPTYDTTYRIAMWAETIDVATVRIHLVIDGDYWTMDDTSADRIEADGRITLVVGVGIVSTTAWFDNIQIFSSPPHIPLLRDPSRYPAVFAEAWAGTTHEVDDHPSVADPHWLTVFGSSSDTDVASNRLTFAVGVGDVHAAILAPGAWRSRRILYEGVRASGGSQGLAEMYGKLSLADEGIAGYIGVGAGTAAVAMNYWTAALGWNLLAATFNIFDFTQDSPYDMVIEVREDPVNRQTYFTVRVVDNNGDVAWFDHFEPWNDTYNQVGIPVGVGGFMPGGGSSVLGCGPITVTALPDLSRLGDATRWTSPVDPSAAVSKAQIEAGEAADRIYAKYRVELIS